MRKSSLQQQQQSTCEAVHFIHHEHVLMSVLHVSCITLTYLIGSFALSENKDGPYFE